MLLTLTLLSGECPPKRDLFHLVEHQAVQVRRLLRDIMSRNCSKALSGRLEAAVSLAELVQHLACKGRKANAEEAKRYAALVEIYLNKLREVIASI